MPIHTLQTYAASNLVRGIAFKPGGTDIWLASPSGAFLEQMTKATGVIVADHAAGAQAWEVLFDPGSNQFYTSSAGGGASAVLSRYSAAGVLIDNPVVGLNPYGIIVANGTLFAGLAGDTFISEIPAGAGTPTTQVDTTIFGVSGGVGQAAFDGTDVWFTAQNSTLFQVNGTTGALLNTFDLTGQGVGRIAGICFKGGRLYLADRNNANIATCDLAGNVLSQSAFAFSEGPIIWDGTYFWIMDVLLNLLSVYNAALTFLASVAVAAGGQWVANDPADGPGIVWATSGANVVQQFQFVPPVPPPAGGNVIGTFAGFTKSGHFGGGTK